MLSPDHGLPVWSGSERKTPQLWIHDLNFHLGPLKNNRNLLPEFTGQSDFQRRLNVTAPQEFGLRSQTSREMSSLPSPDSLAKSAVSSPKRPNTTLDAKEPFSNHARIRKMVPTKFRWGNVRHDQEIALKKELLEATESHPQSYQELQRIFNRTPKLLGPLISHLNDKCLHDEEWFKGYVLDNSNIMDEYFTRRPDMLKEFLLKNSEILESFAMNESLAAQEKQHEQDLKQLQEQFAKNNLAMKKAAQAEVAEIMQELKTFQRQIQRVEEEAEDSTLAAVEAARNEMKQEMIDEMEAKLADHTQEAFSKQRAEHVKTIKGIVDAKDAEIGQHKGRVVELEKHVTHLKTEIEQVWYRHCQDAKPCTITRVVLSHQLIHLFMNIPVYILVYIYMYKYNHSEIFAFFPQGEV
jgi:hypothetical protein